MQFFKFELSIKNVCLTSNEQSREFMQQKANEFFAKRKKSYRFFDRTFSFATDLIGFCN